MCWSLRNGGGGFKICLLKNIVVLDPMFFRDQWLDPTIYETISKELSFPSTDIINTSFIDVF